MSHFTKQKINSKSKKYRKTIVFQVVKVALTTNNSIKVNLFTKLLRFFDI